MMDIEAQTVIYMMRVAVNELTTLTSAREG
jgi:hypothetical protein